MPIITIKKMKNLFYIILIIQSTFCFGQSDYVPVENNDKDGNYNNRTNIVKLDSINKITFIKLDSKSSVKLSGLWFDFDHVNYKKEGLVPYSQIFVDDNNTMFEILIFSVKAHRKISGYFNYKDFSKDYPQIIKKANGEIISTQINKEKNFKLFKVKMPSQFNKDVIFTSYHLIGGKNNDIYRLVLYNIDETNFENFDKFLMDTFNNN